MHNARADTSALGRMAAFVIARAPLMIGGWLLFVVAVNVLVPQLESVVAKDSTPFVPPSAPSLRAVKAMDDTFGNGRSRAFLAVVAERGSGLTAADQRYVVDLAARLRRDTSKVAYVQDVSEPLLRQALTSKDGKAIYFTVGVPGYTGAPTSVSQVDAVREEAVAGKPAGLDVKVTGASATITDMVVEVEHSILLITAVTVVLIAIILFVIYRSLVVTAFVLSVIGLALGAARGATAFLGLHVLDVSTFTGSFLTGVVLGATTDYAIFLISRFQELRREGVEAREAARIATARVAAVILGSALTVVLATACLGLAHVGLFRTTGPPIAVSVLLALGISLTLTPPLLAILGARGLLEPRPHRPGAGGWERLGALVVAKPGRVLAAGLVPLLLLAALFPLFEPSYDERRVQPGDTESNDGYALMDAHFPVNESLPDFVLVSADHDLRNQRDLAALERAADAVAQIPGVASVRGVTRPTGTTITQASLGYQAGVIGDRLGRASDRVKAGTNATGRLVDGAAQLQDGAGRLSEGADAAADGAGRLVDGVSSLNDGLQRLASGSGKAAGGTRQLRAAARTLAEGLDTAVTQTQVAVDGLGLAYDALRTKSLTCSLDVACKRAREGIRQIYEAERDQLVPGLRAAAAGARKIADGTGDLDQALARISAGLDTAEHGSAQLLSGQRRLHTSLGRLADGTDRLADASGQVAGGTGKVAGAMGELQNGLASAASYLRSASAATKGPQTGGFYLPPSALKDPRFALASGAYLSPDGKVARLIVLGETNAFGHAAAKRVGTITDTIRGSLHGSGLQDSAVSATGMAATNADIQRLSQSDFRLVATVALVAVFLVLLLLIRSLVAASVLLGSVVLSYAATIGLSVLVWQILLDVPLEWTVACIAFVLLVAVGADYNLLLIKRIHEESPDGSRAGVARAVTATGGVITAAGVIFAASMFAMMSGSVTTLVQLGFTVGCGLLLDTFVVRTLVVPAFAALAGPRLWWPSRA
ncbi:MAG: MMPL family transporter [Nocardioidaceae bacterium]|nr:MMPL family transporter [Nocardioidaceae bacterium]